MNNIVDKYGLSDFDKKEMNRIFKKYPNIQEVIIFGSRAKGTHKPASDVDLAIVCDNGAKTCSSESLKIISSLKFALEEDTKIPYFFDVLDLKNINSEELKEHIRIYGDIIYENK